MGRMDLFCMASKCDPTLSTSTELSSTNDMNRRFHTRISKTKCQFNSLHAGRGGRGGVGGGDGTSQEALGL
jgi:hypothetical protein